MCEDDIFCGVNITKSANVDEMSDLEKKHTPVIESPKGETYKPLNRYAVLKIRSIF